MKGMTACSTAVTGSTVLPSISNSKMAKRGASAARAAIGSTASINWAAQRAAASIAASKFISKSIGSRSDAAMWGMSRSDYARTCFWRAFKPMTIKPRPSNPQVAGSGTGD